MFFCVGDYVTVIFCLFRPVSFSSATVAGLAPFSNSEPCFAPYWALDSLPASVVASVPRGFPKHFELSFALSNKFIFVSIRFPITRVFLFAFSSSAITDERITYLGSRVFAVVDVLRLAKKNLRPFLIAVLWGPPSLLFLQSMNDYSLKLWRGLKNKRHGPACSCATGCGHQGANFPRGMCGVVGTALF